MGETFTETAGCADMVVGVQLAVVDGWMVVVEVKGLDVLTKICGCA
jgi:hypothetical protein